MSLFNKINKILSTTFTPLKSDLLRLNSIQSGLGDDAVKYVSKGKPETVLATLDHNAAEGLLDVCQNYVHEKETLARRSLLPEMAKKDLDMLERYINVLTVLQSPFPSSASGSSKCTSAVRVFFSEYFSVLERNRHYSDSKKIKTQILNLDVALEVTRKLGGDVSDLIDVIYSDNGHWGMITGKPYRGAVDMKPFVLAKIDAGIEAAQRMPAQGRADFIGDLRKWDVAGQEKILNFILKQAGDGSKAVREASLQALKTVSFDKIEKPAINLLSKGTVNLRAGMVELLALSGSKIAIDALKEHRKKEKTARVVATIDNLLSVEEAVASVELADDQSAYTAIDGSKVEIPALRPLKAGEKVTFGVDDKAALQKIIEDENANIKERNEESKSRGYSYRQDLIKPSLADDTVKLFNKIESLDSLTIPAKLESFFMNGPAKKWILGALTKFGEGQALRFSSKVVSGSSACMFPYASNVFMEVFRDYLSRPHADLRNLELIDIQLNVKYRGSWRNIDMREIRKGDFLRRAIPDDSYYQGSPDDIPNEALWPYVAEQFDVLDEAFGLRPQNDEKLGKVGAIRYLQSLPKTPMRYFGPLLEIATGVSKAGRAEARKMLVGIDGVEERLIALLDDSRQAVRAGSAEWLADLKASSAIKPLKARLKKEKSEVARAAILTCLDKLGEDLSDYLGPKALLDEAEKGLKKAKFDKLDWLAMDHLSTFKYKSGRIVPTEVPKWWLYLAFKLKQPGGNKLFDIYLEQLADDDAEALSTWVFNSWVNYDSAKPPEEEANAYAKANAINRFNSMKQWYEEYTEDQAFIDLKREHQSAYLHSGAASKGLLALAKKTPSSLAADVVRAYLKNHGSRTSQASSLLQVLANIGDPVTLQVVISAATRLKQKGVQKFAGELLQQVATDRNWSLDELADRTIPTAGLSDDGLLELPCANGEKVYQAFLDDDLKLGLHNPAGKLVKALSAGTDDETKASKKQLSASRRELKQVVTMQSTRLYESLCAERIWNKEDWLRDFRDHPVMRRITERVVWLALDEDEGVKTSFRPTAEGDYTDAEDNSVDPTDFSLFKLAHGALLVEETKKQWLEHLADYEVKAIFPQFDRELLTLESDNVNDKHIKDREGWVTDTFTVRGFASKLGYDRGEAMDGGYFNEYRKSFGSAGQVAVIEFSGNCLPEENVPAALVSLHFEKLTGNNRSGGISKLSDVPPVLLSECWNDYYAMASKANYEKDWLKKMPWM